MIFSVKAFPKRNPNEVGELLRNEFFKEEYAVPKYGRYRKLGCYDTFELAEDVVTLPDEPIDPDYPSEGSYHVFEKIIDNQKVTMMYYWDGDGDLSFYFEDGSCVTNDDCKKTYNWEYFETGKPEEL